MAVERVIGIDFGTSTSMVQMKLYNNGLPVGATEAVDYVRFDGKSTVPTLLYRTAEGQYLAGYAAENAAVKGELIQNFKLQLMDENVAVQTAAAHHTQLFLTFLYQTYQAQKQHFAACEEETTYISYPAKWPDNVREQMVLLAEKAGFKNVFGLDEPTAAVHTVMVQQQGHIQLRPDGSANVLMIDMGAGTTDLVLCRYTPAAPRRMELLNVWPKANGSSMFGGREMDEGLCEYLKTHLVNCGLPNVKNFKEKYLSACKAWKENNVSQTLRSKNGVVRYCGFADALTSMLETETEFPPISRAVLEQMFEPYLSQFVGMIHDCLNDAGMPGEEVDYVILTGGHSQWYFATEIVQGTLTRFGRVDLPKIQADANRVIRLSRPQETVALGLVYQKVNLLPCTQTAQGTAASEPLLDAAETDQVVCPVCGTVRPALQQSCPQCSALCHRPAPGTQATAAPLCGETLYALAPGKTLAGAAQVLYAFLSEKKKMETNMHSTESGGVVVQARARGGQWRQLIGMDTAITVTLEMHGEEKLGLRIGEAKWEDKWIAMGVSMFVLWPLSVTSGIGMYLQGKLPGELRNAVAYYIAS